MNEKNIEIKPLSPNLITDYLNFFDNMEFPEHPGWKKCYCYSYHFTGTPEEWSIDGRNRAKAVELIESNHLRGFLAFKGNKAIGWCNANDRKNYERLTLNKDIIIDDDKVCSVVCFVISPEYRRMGIADMLLKRVCRDYSSKQYNYIEAYPEKNISSDEDNYNGPLRLYKKNSFQIHKEFENYYIVRRMMDEC